VVGHGTRLRWRNATTGFMGSLSLFPFQTHLSQLHWATQHQRQHDRQNNSARVSSSRQASSLAHAAHTRHIPLYSPRYSYLAHSQCALQLVINIRIGEVQVAGEGDVAMEMSVVGASFVARCAGFCLRILKGAHAYTHTNTCTKLRLADPCSVCRAPRFVMWLCRAMPAARGRRRCVGSGSGCKL